MNEKIIYNTKIDSVTNLGAGVAREGDGRTVFINGGVDGDVCDCVVTKTHASYSIGEILKLHSLSKHRIAPECSAFTDGCGGCTFRHISYEHELSIKYDHTASLFRRAGLDVTPEAIRSAGADAPRTKATVPVAHDGCIGYYRRGSHEVSSCRSCMLHDSLTNEILTAVEAMLKESKPAGLHHVSIRRGSGGLMVIFISDHEHDIEFAKDTAYSLQARFPDIVSIYFCLQKKDSVRGKYTLIFGSERIVDRLTNCDFLISPDAFYQVNHDAAEILYTLAKEYADIRDGETVADLYCGTGTIGISVIKNSGVDARLFGIEIVPSAVEDAKQNAKNNDVKAEFFCGDAAKFDTSADCVIVDPPRAGCDKRLIAYLLKTAPERIVYISCDPATLVRDLKILSERYCITAVTPVDMFPRTSHCECIVRMCRKDVPIKTYIYENL